MRIELGDYVFEAGSSGFYVIVSHGVNEDSIDFRMEQMQALGTPAPGDFALTQFTLYSTTPRLSGDALPSIGLLDLALWEITSAEIGFETPAPLANSSAGGSIDSLVVVPEPGCLAFVALALIASAGIATSRARGA